MMEQKEAFSCLCGCICKMASSRDDQRKDNSAITCAFLKHESLPNCNCFHSHHHKMCLTRTNCSCISYMSVSFPYSCSWKYLFDEFTPKMSLFRGQWVGVFIDTTAEHIRQQYRRYLGGYRRLEDQELFLTFMGPCIVRIFEYISNKMQRYTVYFIWKLLYMFRVVPPPETCREVSI